MRTYSLPGWWVNAFLVVACAVIVVGFLWATWRWDRRDEERDGTRPLDLDLDGGRRRDVDRYRNGPDTAA